MSPDHVADLSRFLHALQEIPILRNKTGRDKRVQVLQGEGVLWNHPIPYTAQEFVCFFFLKAEPFSV